MKKSLSLQERIRDYVRSHLDNEAALTAPAIATALNEDMRVVSFVLDSFLVDADGDGVCYVGTGAGGGWVPIKEETPEEQLKRQLELSIISQEDYDLRMELIKRGEDPRSAEAMRVLLAERAEEALEKEDAK